MRVQAWTGLVGGSPGPQPREDGGDWQGAHFLFSCPSHSSSLCLLEKACIPLGIVHEIYIYEPSEMDLALKRSNESRSPKLP